jgi:hypothetical protein
MSQTPLSEPVQSPEGSNTSPKPLEFPEVSNISSESVPSPEGSRNPPQPARSPDGPETPRKRRATELTRDQRIAVQTARLFGHTYMEISQVLGITFRQVQNASKGPITPQKRLSGRRSMSFYPVKLLLF